MVIEKLKQGKNLIIPLYRHSRTRKKVMSIRLSVYPETVKQTRLSIFLMIELHRKNYCLEHECTLKEIFCLTKWKL
jgi:hypothetical protein